MLTLNALLNSFYAIMQLNAILKRGMQTKNTVTSKTTKTFQISGERKAFSDMQKLK